MFVMSRSKDSTYVDKTMSSLGVSICVEVISMVGCEILESVSDVVKDVSDGSRQ